MEAELTRWSLYHTGHHVVCTERTGPGGLEVQVRYNNLPIAIQRYSRAEDAAEWAEQARFRWQSLEETTDLELNEKTVDGRATACGRAISQVAETVRSAVQFGRLLPIE